MSKKGGGGGGGMADMFLTLSRSVPSRPLLQFLEALLLRETCLLKNTLNHFALKKVFAHGRFFFAVSFDVDIKQRSNA